MAYFDEDQRFPTDISRGCKGGPRFNTTVVVVKSGAEQRNVNWTYPRCEYDVAYGIKTLAQLETVIKWFYTAQGKGYPFRFKDFSDYKSCDEADTISNTDCNLGTGDASETDFQLRKSYTIGSITEYRNIIKPIENTVVCALDGTPEAGFSVDPGSGIVTFNSAPGNGVVVTAGFEFDVLVRFDTDILETTLSDYRLGSATIPLIEVFESD